MIDEKKIKDLEKRITSPNYSETLPTKQTPKTDIAKLKKLAKEIRKTVEDYTIDPTTHTVSGSRP